MYNERMKIEHHDYVVEKFNLGEYSSYNTDRNFKTVHMLFSLEAARAVYHAKATYDIRTPNGYCLFYNLKSFKFAEEVLKFALDTELMFL